MTAYQRIKADAKSIGIYTSKDPIGGYWLANRDGSPLYKDDNFCSTLRELKFKIVNH
tara:strand:+ start:3034 stop:3204 length:171 start_codon:yes stop_codon:yes gene_type:complete